MPFTGRDAFVFALLILCVPFQHFLVTQFSTSSEHRSSKLNNILRELQLYNHGWISPKYWFKWMVENISTLLKNDYSHWYPPNNNPEGECPAVEVIQFLNPSGFFATSPKPRTRKSSEIKWHIGQVVRHKHWGYKAVIIGWDEYCKASESWITQEHKENLHWRSQPNYALLVHKSDKAGKKIYTYVPQENISPIRDKITHSQLPKYFSSYDGTQYIPQPWLAAIYPLD